MAPGSSSEEDALAGLRKKVATLTVINGALQKECDDLRARASSEPASRESFAEAEAACESRLREADAALASLTRERDASCSWRR